MLLYIIAIQYHKIIHTMLVYISYHTNISSITVYLISYALCTLYTCVYKSLLKCGVHHTPTSISISTWLYRLYSITPVTYMVSYTHVVNCIILLSLVSLYAPVLPRSTNTNLSYSWFYLLLFHTFTSLLPP